MPGTVRDSTADSTAACVNNFTGNGNVASVYRNARVPNGVTGMKAASFGREPVTNGTMARASAADLARAGMVRGQMPVAPSRESTQFSNRAASTQGLPRSNENARFVSRTQPAGVEHVPFEQQRQSMTQMSQRMAVQGAAQQGAARGAGGFNEPGARNSGGGPAGGGGGWQRLDPSRGGPSSAGVERQGNFAGGNRSSFNQNGAPAVNGAAEGSRSYKRRRNREGPVRLNPCASTRRSCRTGTPAEAAAARLAPVAADMAEAVANDFLLDFGSKSFFPRTAR